MYKLVALCALFAVAAADPQVYAFPQTTLPLALAPTFPRTTSTIITNPAPFVYSAPVTYTHLIKKRSPQLPLTYVAPTTYISGAPLATTYTAPLIHNAPFVAPAISSPVYTTAHLIKKRSAPYLPSTYSAAAAYTATAPLVTSYASSVPLISSYSPIVSTYGISQPLAYAQYIKK